MRRRVSHGDDRAFALEDRCPHKGGPLSQGIVHGASVTCPLHNWVISLETGEAQGADEGSALRCRCKVVEGRLMIDLSGLRRRAAPRRVWPGATRTTCPYCGVGCGVLARRAGRRGQIKGDPEHPANFGRLCSKGSALGETLSLDGRLLHADRRRRARRAGTRRSTASPRASAKPSRSTGRTASRSMSPARC